MEEETKSRIGQTLRGQAWIELHGEFTPAQLRVLADEIEGQCKGLERKNDNQERHNSQLGSIPPDN